MWCTYTALEPDDEGGVTTTVEAVGAAAEELVSVVAEEELVDVAAEEELVDVAAMTTEQDDVAGGLVEGVSLTAS